MQERAGPDPQATQGAREEVVRDILRRAGFARVGFARARGLGAAERLRAWLDAGYAGTMGYLARSAERRVDPEKVLAGARAVVVVALPYRPASATPPATRGRGVISAYARGDDYHRVLGRRLRRACTRLREALPASYRWYVDTGPVLEKAWAAEAGIGWTGKNTCSIHPAAGSFFFLGVILTTLELAPDPPVADQCGTCTLCLEACPTGALVEPYVLDARRCISYLTIEHRGTIQPELEERLGNLIFGCDICQDVCPWNRRAAGMEADGDLEPRPENVSPELRELAFLDPDGFRRRFPRSAVRRARHEGLVRNAVIALGNAGGPEALEVLEALGRAPWVRARPELEAARRRAEERARGRLGGGGGAASPDGG